MLMEHAADPDELVHEWTESIVGDQYPMPDRILKYTEILVQDYLNQKCATGNPRKVNSIYSPPKEEQRDVLCIRLRWKKNFLLHKGDSITLMVPIFTPYTRYPN